MARSDKLKTAAPKDSAESLIETIVDDVLKTAAMPFEDWLSQNRFPMIPMTIPADAGRGYNVTQAGVDAAQRLTAQTWNERFEFRQTIERSAFDRVSFRAIGEALTSSPSHLPPDAQTRGQDPLPEGFFSRCRRLPEESRSPRRDDPADDGPPHPVQPVRHRSRRPAVCRRPGRVPAAGGLDLTLREEQGRAGPHPIGRKRATAVCRPS
ncbi:hypothetical protein [Bradyrhizobium sp. I71]|uniref:hypothetical protein n=1 Tax=Bradyrhizobium sp. I71 TaxID=2590772 RepID=UPI001EF8FFAB|nr:hypothetical protein [Bradyrhizobium sp. I71]ULL01570.1 hypothetical protein FJV43_18320 [Bradyrhizobium sp. I71]